MVCFLAKISQTHFMNTFDFKRHWNDVRNNLKQTNSNLTDDDLRYEEGKEDELIGRLQQRLGKNRQETVSLLESLDRQFHERNKGFSGNDRPRK
jgi:uncharacterized protein YjbJ (UPF0337 family)